MEEILNKLLKNNIIEYIELNTNEIKVMERKEQGRGEITLKFYNNCKFIKINPEEFNKNLQNLFISGGDCVEEPNLSKICDGIIIYTENDVCNLILVELKKTINNDNYIKVKQQLEATYVKIMMVLNIIYDITKINLFCIIAHDTKNKTEKKMFVNKMQNIPKNNGEYGEFLENKKIILKEIPFFFEIPINEPFIKKNIEIHNIKFNECFKIL
ncbi:MAG: hypothetical protein A2086_00180 [Spirochaetes bacterium GWD1_27_9]|nr:MAG: hypothetical protein A2Z98_04170 [Spirochaetes bacterium GWB1_27_13]OHD20019.1 MAG: hypothetical protein A2Y34_08185 [Spirochaetes bacterium GWC1_27_15]OHD30490.1 MAG: hypothetical protein A2086_00180 [Spirochaetes bacterium GWD1_27_9]